MRLLFLLAFPASVGIVVWRVPLSQNADGLLETIMSLQRLTLFYWGQSRFANILPLLASPIRNPVLNADAQLGARIVLGLLAPIFACALLSASEARLSVTRATLLSALLFLASAPNRIIEEALTQTSPFGTSFVLLGASVLALRRAEAAPAANGAARRWRAAGLALAVAAFLQNVSLALEAAPLAVGLCVLARSRVVVGFAVVSAIALLVTMLAMTLCAPAAAPHIGGFGKSLAGLRVYGGYLVGPPGLCLWAVLALAIAGHCLGRRDPAARVRRRGDLVLVATIAASFVATGLSDWVVSNGAHPRYLVPVYLLAASLGGLTVERMIRTFVMRVASGTNAVLRPWRGSCSRSRSPISARCPPEATGSSHRLGLGCRRRSRPRCCPDISTASPVPTGTSGRRSSGWSSPGTAPSASPRTDRRDAARSSGCSAPGGFVSDASTGPARIAPKRSASRSMSRSARARSRTRP